MSALVDSTVMVPLLWLGILGAVTVLAYQKWFGSTLDIPRVGQKPTLLGNTSKGEFYQKSVEMVNEGYAKVKHPVYCKEKRLTHCSTKILHTIYGRPTWIGS